MTQTASLAARIARLSDQPWPELKAEWKQLFGAEPTVINRRFVERRIAHRWQETEFAKTDPHLLERNRQRIDALIDSGSLDRFGPGRLPPPGTVLTREHGGVEHRVMVLEHGTFEYQGQRFTSLSRVARAITGTQWSGPAFFGLRTRSKK